MIRLYAIPAMAVFGMMALDNANAQAPPAQKSPAPVHNPQVNQRFSSPITQTPWFNNSAVRQQLNLNDAQFNQLNNAYGNAYSQFQKNISNLDPKLTPSQRVQRTQELQQRFYNSFADPTNQVFTDPQMRARYNQLQLQYRGYDALQDPAIQNQLNLTPEQRQKLAQYQTDWQKTMTELQRAYQANPQSVTTPFNEMNQREFQRMNAVFNEQQRQTWRQMVGTPYTFQPSVYFPQPIQQK